MRIEKPRGVTHERSRHVWARCGNTINSTTIIYINSNIIIYIIINILCIVRGVTEGVCFSCVDTLLSNLMIYKILLQLNTIIIYNNSNIIRYIIINIVCIVRGVTVKGAQWGGATERGSTGRGASRMTEIY